LAEIFHLLAKIVGEAAGRRYVEGGVFSDGAEERLELKILEGARGGEIQIFQLSFH